MNPTNKQFEDQVQTTKGTSWVVRHYSKAITTWLATAILKIDMTSYFGSGYSDLNEIRQPDAEWHADYGDMVEIETEVEFQYGGRLCFETGRSYISAANCDVSDYPLQS